MKENDTNEKKEEQARRTELALRNNTTLISRLKYTIRFRLACITNSRLRRLYSEYQHIEDPECKLDMSGEILDMFDGSIFRKSGLLICCLKEDIRLFFERSGRNKVIDHSDRKAEDYYSVIAIVKNEARYIREFILFYQATGADRIYIYDNGSTDDLLEVIEPFMKTGLVVYISWPGHIAQHAAYRNAIRRTKHRTKWLAIVDADEYLFSPKGRMPDLLKDYEKYPGVGANWLAFGPSGHDRRPKGLIMDNYTSTLANYDALVNCHIKSIVQPAKVFTMNHPHYALYKGGNNAVNEDKEYIGCKNAYVYSAGKAFTEINHRSVFRINHYITKSLEDLEEKCRRGYPDGTPNAVFESQLKPFEEPLTDDFTIKPYADIVRERY